LARHEWAEELGHATSLVTGISIVRQAHRRDSSCEFATVVASYTVPGRSAEGKLQSGRHAPGSPDKEWLCERRSNTTLVGAFVDANRSMQAARVAVAL